MCKPCVNQILPCANQNQPCVNCFAPCANPQFSAIPTCFAKPSGHTSYFHVLITCRTFPVQPGEVTFWDQKKFTHFITVSPGLPPDGRRAAAESGSGVSAPANRSAAAKSSRSTGCSPAEGGVGRVRHEVFGMVAWGGASLSEKDGLSRRCASSAMQRQVCARGRKGRGWGHAC